MVKKCYKKFFCKKLELFIIIKILVILMMKMMNFSIRNLLIVIEKENIKIWMKIWMKIFRIHMKSVKKFYTLNIPWVWVNLEKLIFKLYKMIFFWKMILVNLKHSNILREKIKKCLPLNLKKTKEIHK